MINASGSLKDGYVRVYVWAMVTRTLTAYCGIGCVMRPLAKARVFCDGNSIAVSHEHMLSGCFAGAAGTRMLMGAPLRAQASLTSC